MPESKKNYIVRIPVTVEEAEPTLPRIHSDKEVRLSFQASSIEDAYRHVYNALQALIRHAK